jgi:type II secretion system protein C
VEKLRATEQLATPAKRRRFGVAALLAAVLITVTGLWIDRFAPFERWAHSRAHPAPTSVKPLPAVADTGAITIVQPEPIGTDSSISKDPMPLVLTGTRLGRNAREGYADIGVHALSPQTYKAGALLANGARLEEIYSDYVVLTRGAHRVRLYITGRSEPERPRSATDVALLSVGGQAPTKVAVASSHDVLTDIMRASPVYDGDTLQALQLYSGTQSDAFTQLGLEPGDKVTAIEGVALKSPAEAMAQLRQLTEGAAMTVTIERGGKRQTLSLDGSALKSMGTRG